MEDASAKYRPIENLHIALWLVKDASWVAGLHVLGVAMIIPTFGVALWMCWKWRKNWSELAHNAAVAMWICANSIWMIGEFFFRDSLRSYSIFFFIIGIAILAIYYGRRIIKS